MFTKLSKYAQWLHLQWPAGRVERLPQLGAQGRCKIPGVYIVGDLTGVPLLKMALSSGVAAIKDAQQLIPKQSGDTDVIIIGGGVSGVAAAIEAKQQGLSVKILEANQLFSTIVNFPKGKPIFTYPSELIPDSALQVSGENKEALLAELQAQAAEHQIDYVHCNVDHVTAHGNSVRVILNDKESLSCKIAVIAIGRSGNYRRMQIPGEDLDKVSNRMHDPASFTNKQVLIVGGGDSACESAIAIATLNQSQTTSDSARVTLAYRGHELSRPKPENTSRVIELAQAGAINLQLGSQVTAIDQDAVHLKNKHNEQVLKNDYVLSMIGREAPLDFFRRSGIPIHGENSVAKKIGLLAFLLLITCIYGMKGWIGPFADLNYTIGNPGTWMTGFAEIWNDPRTLLGTIFKSAQSSGFWVTVAYSAAVVGFGIDRIRRRRTPYVTRQTLTLMSIQVLPLFILPEIILPWMGANNLLPQIIIDNLFPATGAGDPSYWRAYGFILAWPLMAWNIFTESPLWWWIIIGCIQTFVIIPFIVWRWGKGAYCGWVCSCGALAETMGDRHREKMPHGKVWNRLNFIGQGILLIAFIMLALFAISWAKPTLVSMDWLNTYWLKGFWKHGVDWILAGALGTGLYFWLSGRVWCRFACPLAALMHIYARFSKFRIVVDSKKCISCNACTSVCHQGIDIMNFANKGKHMEDPECVRCSACVQTCPTGVLQFGQVDGQETVTAVDTLGASPVIMAEKAKP